MTEKAWDLIVVGGGPAGMMAAGRASELGAKVLLLEKNATLGQKLLITGGGRCNVTNAELDQRKLLSKFEDADKFLFSPFAQFDNLQALEFFHSHNMPTKVEAEQRAFPQSDSAQSVWDVLVNYLKSTEVTVRSNTEVTGFINEGNKIIGVKLKGGEKIEAKKFVLATGGKSRPETGSTGEGFKWLSDLGHKVTEPAPSLVPIMVEETWVKKLSGVSLSEAKVTLFQNQVKQEVRKGKVLFTHFGLSGPAILNMSKDIDELLKYGEVEISLDLLPSHDYSTLNTALQELFKIEDKKKLKNALSFLIPSALVSAVAERSQVNPDTPCNSVTREDRLALVQVLKDMRMKVTSLLGTDKAIITSGGVALEEIDFKTMQSKLYSNLYLVGDLLDIDRPSGGYSLQLCWTTGFVAGTSAVTSQGQGPHQS